MKKPVLITGAEGRVGIALRKHLADRYDLRYLTRGSADFPSHVADISDLNAILPAFNGVGAVVHLAAVVAWEAPWDEILHSNIIGTRNVFEAARQCGVGTVVYASSNHTIGMYEKEQSPDLYDRDDVRVYDHTVEVRPDSLYGVSKVFGEAIGRYYADNFGMRVYCLRIGTLRKDDNPCSPGVAASPSWPHLTAEQKYERLRATWLSHRDCAELVACCLEAETVPWAVVYGISNNPRQFWDLSHARQLLRYEPKDRAPANPA
jgi:nucleoside-diphosphate-sugar epimerase